MKGMTWSMLLGLVVLALVLVIVVRARRQPDLSQQDTFKAKKLLTPNENEFLLRLETALPELRICPQVAMGALLDPSAPRSDRKAYFRQRGQYSQKIVDFVAQRRSDGEVVAIIELDDRTHDSGKDSKRDAMLRSAGYRTIRWDSRRKPDTLAIRAALFPPLPAGSATQVEERLEPFLAAADLTSPRTSTP